MGKGDIKSKKGKISNGSFGNSRPRKATKAVAQTKEVVAEKPVEKKPVKKK